jgi:hypothetical protein
VASIPVETGHCALAKNAANAQSRSDGRIRFRPCQRPATRTGGDENSLPRPIDGASRRLGVRYDLSVKLPLLVAAIAALGCGGRALRIPTGVGGNQAGGPRTGTGAGGAGTAGTIGMGGVAGVGGATLPPTLRPSDLAWRLSLFIWQAAPDDNLLRQVEADPPASRDDVRRLATEMLKDPRARA